MAADFGAAMVYDEVLFREGAGFHGISPFREYKVTGVHFYVIYMDGELCADGSGRGRRV